MISAGYFSNIVYNIIVVYKLQMAQNICFNVEIQTSDLRNQKTQ